MMEWQKLCKVQKKIWVPNGRLIVKTVLKQCYVRKKKYIKDHCYPLPPTPPRPIPFKVTSVDFSGAIFLRNEDELQKSTLTAMLFT